MKWFSGLTRAFNIAVGIGFIALSSTSTAASSQWLIGLSANSPGQSQILATVERGLTDLVGDGADVTPLLAPGVYQITLPDIAGLAKPTGITDQRVISLLSSVPGVKKVAPNITLSISRQVPNDIAYRDAQASYLGSANYASLNMPEAWQLSRGSRNTVIAVLDSGILYGHPELKGRVLPGYDFVSTPSSAPGTPSDGRTSGSNDGDGIDSDPSDPGDAPPVDVACPTGQQGSSFHGTGVASVAAALSNNASGMTGIDWNARILPVRVSGRCGLATTADILNGIYWALQFESNDPSIAVNPYLPDVINISLAAQEVFLQESCSGATGTFFSQAFADAAALGVPVVVSAGNVAGAIGNSGAALQFPASCSNAIAAAAVRPDGTLAFYSSRGKARNALTIGAPGDEDAFYLTASNQGDVNGAPTTDGHNLVFQQGTSFSAPMISGVIALMKGLVPDLTHAEVIERLANTAKPLAANNQCSQDGLGGILSGGFFNDSAGGDNVCVDGIVDPLPVLKQTLRNGQPVANIPASQLNAGSALILDGAASQNGGGAGSLIYNWQQLAGSTVQLSGQSSPTLSVTGLSDAPVSIGLTVTDTASNLSHSASMLLAASDAQINGPVFLMPSKMSEAGNQAARATAPTQTDTNMPIAQVSEGGGGGGASWLAMMGFIVLMRLHRLRDFIRER